MACGGCAARRRRLMQAAKARSISGVLTEAAKGAAEMSGLRKKTALEENRQDAAKMARLARRSSPPEAWPTE